MWRNMHGLTRNALAHRCIPTRGYWKPPHAQGHESSCSAPRGPRGLFLNWWLELTEAHAEASIAQVEGDCSVGLHHIHRVRPRPASLGLSTRQNPMVLDSDESWAQIDVQTRSRRSSRDYRTHHFLKRQGLAGSYQQMGVINFCIKEQPIRRACVKAQHTGCHYQELPGCPINTAQR